MTKTYLYIPDELDKQVMEIVRYEKRSKADVLREALENGVVAARKKNSAGIDVLFKIAELGKKYHLKGPRDGSVNMDKYLWDKDWSKDE